MLPVLSFNTKEKEFAMRVASGGEHSVRQQRMSLRGSVKTSAFEGGGGGYIRVLVFHLEVLFDIVADFPLSYNAEGFFIYFFPVSPIKTC